MFSPPAGSARRLSLASQASRPSTGPRTERAAKINVLSQDLHGYLDDIFIRGEEKNAELIAKMEDQAEKDRLAIQQESERGKAVIIAESELEKDAIHQSSKEKTEAIDREQERAHQSIKIVAKDRKDTMQMVMANNDKIRGEAFAAVSGIFDAGLEAINEDRSDSDDEEEVLEIQEEDTAELVGALVAVSC